MKTTPDSMQVTDLSHSEVDDSDSADTTIIVVPRERGSLAVDSLRAIYETTSYPFDLVYVDCMLPWPVRRKVRTLVKENGDTFARSKQKLYPNEAANIGMGVAGNEPDFFVVLDNDVFLEPEWLERLVGCAKQTGAGVVGPLYLEGDRTEQVVHCAGGEINIVEDAAGEPRAITQQKELGLPIEELPDLERGETGLIEFHCVLISEECLDAIGGKLDEGIRNTRRHLDLCLMAEEAGYDVYLEPDSRVNYSHEVQLKLYDLPYYMFRWSDEATQETIEHFERKWDVKLDPERREIIQGRRIRAIRDILERYRLDLAADAWGDVRDYVPRSLRPFPEVEPN